MKKSTTLNLTPDQRAALKAQLGADLDALTFHGTMDGGALTGLEIMPAGGELGDSDLDKVSGGGGILGDIDDPNDVFPHTVSC